MTLVNKFIKIIFIFHGWVRDDCQQGYKGYANIDIFYFTDILVPFEQYESWTLRPSLIIIVTIIIFNSVGHY